MAIREPTRPEARLWLARFNEVYARWLSGGSRSEAEFAQLVNSLRHLLEREPEAEDIVESVSVSLLYNCRSGVTAWQGLELIDLAIRASALRGSPSPSRALARAWLENRRAGFLLMRGSWFEARAACNRARTALAGVGQQELVAFLQSEIELNAATAADACLELAAARTAFARAAEFAAPFLDKEKFVRLVTETFTFIFGDRGPRSKQGFLAIGALVHADIFAGWVASRVGLARCDALEDNAEKAKSAQATLAALNGCGIGRVTALDLVPIVRANEVPAAAAIMEASVAKARTLGLPWEDFERVLTAALAANLAGRGVAVTTMLARTRAVAGRSALLEAVALGLELVAKAKADLPGARLAAEDFVAATQRLEGLDEPQLESWRVRQLFDEPMQDAFRHAIAEFTEQRSVAVATATPRKGIKITPTTQTSKRASAASEREERIRCRLLLSSCVDFLQRRPVAFERWSAAGAAPNADPAPHDPKLRQPALLARDRLGRLEHALRSWPEALALIERHCGNETVFIAVNGSSGSRVLRANGEWRTCAAALRLKCAGEIAELQVTGVAAQASVIEPVARDAFKALPAELRELIAQSDDILVCPDYRADGGQTPFELLHNGTQWLGLEKIIARMPSLRALTFSAEGGRRRDSHQRFLGVTVPDAPGVDYTLNGAVAEVGTVRATLAGDGWDSPAIDSAAATPAFVLNRLSLATHAHVSAHGENDAEGDHIVLRGGNLYPRDLLSRFFPQAPTIYLNTCSLGSSHYLGGGLTHGIAHTLVEIGAPAVVANLLPVEDESSALLAKKFYEAREKPFGVALREARRACASTFASPIFWGSTILIGDARVTLKPATRAAALSEEFLDAYFLDPRENRGEAVRGRAIASLLSDPGDVRLQAAVDFVSFVATIPGSPNAHDRPQLIAAFRAAGELDHLPAAAMLAVILAGTFDDEAEPVASAEMLQRAIQIVEPLEKQNDFWAGRLDQLLVRWIQLKRGERRVRAEVRGPASREAAEGLRRLGQAVFDVKLAQEARALRRGLCEREENPASREHEILADAVRVPRSFKLEDAPETAAYTRMLAARLVDAGALADRQAGSAATALAGLLPWLWSMQHETDLPKEVVEGQAGTMARLVESMRNQWPPRTAPWFELVRDFPRKVKSMLDSFNDYSYGDALYRQMTKVFAAIEEEADTLVKRVTRCHAAHVPDAAAWILGCLIEVNTFSYLDGSVPEEIGGKLGKIHDNFAAQGGRLFMPWLSEGFQRVRERPLGELERWTYGIDPPAPGTTHRAPERAVRRRATAARSRRPA